MVQVLVCPTCNAKVDIKIVTRRVLVVPSRWPRHWQQHEVHSRLPPAQINIYVNLVRVSVAGRISGTDCMTRAHLAVEHIPGRVDRGWFALFCIGPIGRLPTPQFGFAVCGVHEPH